MDERPEETQGIGITERLQQEAAALASAPILLAVAAVVAVAAIWAALHWSYTALLSNQDTRMAMLERRAAEYRDAVAGASPEAARGRIESLEAEVQTLRLRLQPRRLTATQRQAISDGSRLPAGAQPNSVAIVMEEGCSDCARFGDDLAEALQAPGSWRVSVVSVKELSGRSRTGLAVRVPDPVRPPPDAVVLQRALRAANLPYLTIGGGGGVVELVVSERLPQ